MAKLISGLGKSWGKEQNKGKKNTHIASPAINTRAEAVRVYSAAGRKIASTRWLTRHFNDPYVQEAQKLGYRSRAAFKLLELEEQTRIISKAKIIIDLGAAPGGWLQIIRQINPNCQLVGCDLLEIEPITNCTIIQGDFTHTDIQAQIIASIDGQKPDLILSDMSPNMTGHKGTDHDKIALLLENAWDFAKKHLCKNGHFISKTRESGMESDLLKDIKAHFTKTRHIKPKASRKQTSEFYLVASHFTAS